MPSRARRRDHPGADGVGGRVVLQEHSARGIEAGIGFIQVEARRHPHEMLDLDLAARIVGTVPFRNRRGHRGRHQALLSRIPISALTTDLVIEKPSSGVSTPMPAAYRSAIT